MAGRLTSKDARPPYHKLIVGGDEQNNGDVLVIEFRNYCNWEIVLINLMLDELNVNLARAGCFRFPSLFLLPRNVLDLS